MGEYLELAPVDKKMTDEAISAFCAKHLTASLFAKMQICEGRISCKLATCEQVFFSLPEMLEIEGFIKMNPDKFAYSEKMEYNAKPIQILKSRASIYLSNFGAKKRKKTKLVKPCAAVHSKVWRKTSHTCPNAGKEFRAKIEGAAWDYKKNMKRTIYKCPKCGRLFNQGEEYAPELAIIAASL